MSDENETNENDPVENTGNGESAAPIVEPPVADIEGEAAAAAAADPAPAADPEPEPEAAPEVEKPAAKGKAKPTARKRQTAGKRGKDTAQNLAHQAAVKAKRPEPEPAPEPTEAQQAEADAKAENRQRLRDIKEEIADLDAQRDALVEEQQALATFGAHAAADNRPHHVRHREVLARGKETRERRQRDRLKLLAASAGKSPLDQAMGGGPRKSLAAADAANSENE